MYVPSASKHHTPTPEAVRDLVKRIDRPLSWIARESGISERKLRYLLDGYRVMAGGKRIDVLMRYPEQVVLELLARTVEAAAALPPVRYARRR